MRQSGPSLAHGRGIVGPRQRAVADAPCQAIGVESRPTGLRQGRLRVGQQRRRPVACVQLDRLNLRRHLFIQLDEPRAVGIGLRQSIDNPCQTGKHPAIAAAPEHLFTIRTATLEETAVAKNQMLGRII